MCKRKLLNVKYSLNVSKSIVVCIKRVLNVLTVCYKLLYLHPKYFN